MLRPWKPIFLSLIISFAVSAENALAQAPAPAAPASAPAAQVPAVASKRRARPSRAVPAVNNKIEATITILRNGQKLEQKGIVKWDFLEVSPGARALFAQVVFIPPPGAKIVSLEGDHMVAKPGWIRADAAMVALGAMETNIRVKFADNKTETWKAKIEMTKPAFRMRGCYEAGLKVVPSSSVPNVFFAGDCTVKEDRVIFNASVPGDLDWDVTTIFETDGKGERWKIFEISSNNLVTGDDVVANLGFNWQGKKTSFILMQNRGQMGSAAEKLRKEKRDGTRARLDFGVAQFKSETPVTGTSNTSPFLGGEVLTKEIIWGLRANAQGRYVFPVDKGSAVSFAGGGGYVGGDFLPNTNAYGIMGEYVVVQQNQESVGKSISFQHSQFGVNLFYMRLFPIAELKFSLRYNGLGGDSTGLAADVVYEGMLGTETKWGLLLGYSSQSVKSQTGTSSFTQMFLGGNVSF